MAVGQVRREIIGAEHREHAVRLVADRDARAERAFEPPLRRALAISGDRDVDLVDHRLDLGARLPERLAGLAGDQVGEWLELGANDVGEAPQRLDPDREGLGRPGRPGGAGRGDLGVGIAGGAGPQGLAGRRLDRGQGVRHRACHAGCAGFFKRDRAIGPVHGSPRPSGAPPRPWPRAAPSRRARRSPTRSPRLPRYASSRALRRTSKDGRARRGGPVGRDPTAEVGERLLLVGRGRGRGAAQRSAAPVEEEAVDLDRLRRPARSRSRRRASGPRRSRRAGFRAARRSRRAARRWNRCREGLEHRRQRLGRRDLAQRDARAGPGPSGSPRAAGRTNRGRHGRNRRR